MPMIQLTTSRFGVLEVDKSKVIHFVAPIIGFNSIMYYVLLDHPSHGEKSPFQWLQAIGEPYLAFVITEPKLFVMHYEFTVPAEAQEKLKIEQIADLRVYTIVHIPQENPAMMTANFLAPVLINESLMLGVQVILQDPKLSIKTRLLSDAVIRKTAGVKPIHR
jgi:flagellar assembly factor FliW